MARKAVVDAFAARLASVWTTTPIREMNATAKTPLDGSAFVMLQFWVTDERQMSIGAPGNNVFREEGEALIKIFVPRGSGLGTMLDYADTLAGHFRSKSFGGVLTHEVTGPSYDDDNDNGAYFEGDLNVFYQHDIFA